MARWTRILLALVLAVLLGPAAAHAAAPSNDNFSGALSLPVGDQVMGNNVDATHETGEPTPAAGVLTESDCGSINDGPNCTTSVWYTFTPSSSGSYIIETCDLGTDVDTVLAVYTGSTLGTLNEVPSGSNDDSCAGGPGDNGSRVTIAATGGTTYYVEVAGYAAAQGTFWLRSYAGSSPVAAPEPDTLLERDSSLAQATEDGGPPLDGPRHSGSFAFTSDEDGASFECSLDGAAFTVCHSPMSFDGLSGTHTFSVRSIVGGDTDPTPASAVFSVDGTPPETSFINVPSDPTGNPSVSFDLHSSERSWFDTFACALDAQQPIPECDSSDQDSSLCNGPHTFSAAAVDMANNVDATPVTTSFTETGGSSSCTTPNLSVSTASESPTDEDIQASVNVHGDGGTRVVDYGTTSSYGFSRTDNVFPGSTDANATLSYLTPGTLYHYRVTLTTSVGTVTTGDATFTTAAAGSAVPTASLGTPVVVGIHAVAFPVTADSGSPPGSVGVFLDNAPVQPNQSPNFYALEGSPGGVGPFNTTVDVVDLDPGTYRARAFVNQSGPGGMDAVSPEITFTVTAPAGPPATSPPPLPAVHPFKLRKGFVHVLRIRHGSKAITLVISHLPPNTSVGVTVNASVRASALKFLVRGKAKANKLGVARVKMKLSRKARKVLRSKRTKSLSIKVRVKPPGQSASSVTLKPKLKR
jgi:hypothetical protein